MNSTNCGNNLCVDQTEKIYLSNEDQVPLNRQADVKITMPFDFFNYTSTPQGLFALFNTTKPNYKEAFGKSFDVRSEKKSLNSIKS